MCSISVCCDVCGQRVDLSLSVFSVGWRWRGGWWRPRTTGTSGRTSETGVSPSPVSSLQSPQCPRSAQLTATLSFIISAHSLHGPALSTTSRHCRAVTGVTRYTSPSHHTIHTRNTGGCRLGWPSDMSATHWILFQRSVQVVRV